MVSSCPTLSRSQPSARGESDKSGVIVELCRIIRGLGSAIILSVNRRYHEFIITKPLARQPSSDPSKKAWDSFVRTQWRITAAVRFSTNRRFHENFNFFGNSVSSTSSALKDVRSKPQCKTLRALAQFEILYGRIHSKGKPDSSARSCKRSCRFFSSVSGCLPTIFSALVKYRA
jgi:hypothetical protein